jgi:heme exporter protein A
VAISAENLACERGERLVFRGLSFVLGAGEALVLRGPNGAGKSSLLRLCAALLRPAEGRLCWDGADVWREPDAFRARLAYVGHLDGVKPLLTARENVAFWASLRGGDATAGLEAFGVAHLAELPTRFLSAGQKKRVALARLVAAPARLWLLDEPTVSLDQDGAARLAAACAGHRARGGMIVAATHVELGFEDAQTLFLSGGLGGPGRPAAGPRIEVEGDKKGAEA